MSQHLHESDGDVELLISTALNARTAGIEGRSDSLAELRRSLRRRGAPQRHRRWSALGAIATAAVVLLIVVAVNWVGHAYRSTTTPASPNRPSAPLQKTGFGYSPADYFPAVNSDGQPVIVRVSDGRQMRILPRGRVNASTWAPLSPMILSPDGNKVYGVGRELQENGKPYPAGWGVDHVLVIDLRTNQITSLATRGERITGLTLSADGTTFAYALRGSQDGQPDRDVIYVHDLVHDKDRHFMLAAGQRTIIMALSPDGSQLAINAQSNSSAVQVMSTTSGLTQPPQKHLGAAGCQNSRFGPVQWTRSGLYAALNCGSPTGQQPESIVGLSNDPDQPAPVVATTSPGFSMQLVICDSPTGDSPSGLTIYDHQLGFSEYGVSKLATDGQPAGSLPDIRLSGPGT